MTKDKSSSSSPVIVWFRNDLRLSDNLALHEAASDGRPVICLYIREPAAADHLGMGGAQKWWLHHSLCALDKALGQIGASLTLRTGAAADVLGDIVDATGADTIHWNRRYAPAWIEHDRKLKADLKDRGLTVRSFDGHLMHEPTKIETKSGGFYKVYTPFWRAFEGASDEIVRKTVPAPETINSLADVNSESLHDWTLLPTKPDWSGGIAESWTPGEAGAKTRLRSFLDGPVREYDTCRDLPARDLTSRLSPHLAFGEISPVTIWHETIGRVDPCDSRTTFLKELVWREFSYHLLVNVEDLAHANYNDQFDAFPWRDDDEELRAWQRGMTGYPIVDAGMRQLWTTGWMHNRVRMIVGSFLVKHLLMHWHHGERWFWDTLVDADPASNAASWQWVAGSGADAAPYFRIFNPITQGEKFDAEGDYVKTFVPELAKLPKKYIHKPWEAPRDVLAKAGIKLGDTYPKPIVDHPAARQRALDAYDTMRGKRS